MAVDAVAELDPLARQLSALGRLSRGSGPELDALTALVLTIFLRRHGQAEPGRGDLVARAIDRLDTLFAQPLSIADLAQALSCSEGHLYRRFRARTGQTPLAYLNQRRLRHALQLLQHTHLPVAEVARQSGIADPLYFSKVFRKAFGCTPSAARATTRDAASAANGG